MLHRPHGVVTTGRISLDLIEGGKGGREGGREEGVPFNNSWFLGKCSTVCTAWSLPAGLALTYGGKGRERRRGCEWESWPTGSALM